MKGNVKQAWGESLPMIEGVIQISLNLLDSGDISQREINQIPSACFRNLITPW